MKRIILFLLFFVMPVNLLAEDACTNPDEYTIDQRCYVTDEQKKQTPYNAVVGIFGNRSRSEICCTGTIVNQDDEIYIYTAKHCVDKDDGSIEPRLWFKFQNNLIGAGVPFFAAGDGSDSGDWAVYHYMTKNSFNMMNRKVTEYEYAEATADYVYAQNNADDFVEGLTAVGYGSLKIMSDKDIEDFRERYLNYLKQRGVTITEGNGLDYGLFKDGGIATTVESVQQFIDDYGFGALFDDSARLKFSNCLGAFDCQVWSGDSGGPLFDNKNRLIGVRTRGTLWLGGESHAKSAQYVPTISVYEDIKKLKELEPKMILIKDK